ncbi:uncharacterized protein LOC135266827 [Tribolium castaneum]|uniref:uncharacterized protein LOC135266827 n=1 Tax=Tribolium castaneum TaxID=7070 RepID=UPI0030FED5B0
MNDIITIPVVLSSEMLFGIPVTYSSDEDSDVTDEENIVTMMLIKSRKIKKPQRIENYIEATISGYTKQEFQQHFRVTIEAYEQLLQTVGPYLMRQAATGRSTVQVEKQLLSVIWILVTPDSYRSVGERFGLAKSSLSQCFKRVVKILNAVAPTIIKWPEGMQLQNVERRFHAFARMPHCIGAIDGTYVEIKAPKEDPQSYITRKCNYAFTLQAIAVPSLKFTDAFIGYPGSVSDSRIFKNSDFYNAVNANMGHYFAEEHYLIGDKAYPNLPWCIAPYINRGNLNAAQVYFNTVHAQTRQVIERSFALLFGRFRRLKFLDMNDTNSCNCDSCMRITQCLSRLS